MARNDYEALLERYVNGTLSAAEEEEFFIHVALNRELRNDLKAQRILQDAMQKDRNAEPVQHTALRSRVAETLAASPAVASNPEQTFSGAGAREAVAGGPGWAIGTGLIAVAIVAILFSFSIFSSSDSSVDSEDASARPGSVKTAPVPFDREERSGGNGAEPEAVRRSPDIGTRSDAVPAPAGAAVPSASSGADARRSPERPSADDGAIDRVNPPATAADRNISHEDDSAVRRSTRTGNDSVPMRLQLDFDTSRMKPR